MKRRKILIFTLIIFYFFSCGKVCPDRLEPGISDYLILSYSGGESLTFQDTAGILQNVSVSSKKLVSHAQQGEKGTCPKNNYDVAEVSIVGFTNQFELLIDVYPQKATVDRHICVYAPNAYWGSNLEVKYNFVINGVIYKIAYIFTGVLNTQIPHWFKTIYFIPGLGIIKFIDETGDQWIKK